MISDAAFWGIVALIVLTWLALAVLAGIVIGLVIRRCDRQRPKDDDR